MNQIDFWFSVGSTYTCLTIMRLHKVEHEARITVANPPSGVRCSGSPAYADDHVERVIACVFGQQSAV